MGLSEDFAELLHVVTWQPKKGAVAVSSGSDTYPADDEYPPDTGTAAGNAVNGKTNSATPPGQISVLFDPKTPEWVERNYGVMVERAPYLMMGEADDLEPIQWGDLIVWGSKTMKVEAKPKIFRPGDGYDHGEVVVTVQTSGGRS